MKNSEKETTHHYAIIIGANSAIAQATIQSLAKKRQHQKILCFSRSNMPKKLTAFNDQIHWNQTDHTDDSIQTSLALLKEYQGSISDVIIFNGKLHDDEIKPEKRIEDLCTSSFQDILNTNTLTPMIWLKHLLKILKSNTACKVAVLSARVGSIGDNRLGGWYTYRASKAALNMMLQTAAIEFARRAPNIKLIAFHPGTVDTQLSKPFQASVPAEKVFSPYFVAQQLLNIMETTPIDGKLSYLDWNNQPITW